MNWLANKWAALTWFDIGVFFGAFVVSFVFSFLMIGLVIVKIPANYFSTHYKRDFLPGSPFLVRWGAVIAKNLLGLFLVLLGVVLSLPGVPGQGLLTILIGVVMLDIPGKRPWEARLIRRPAILSAVNKLRAKYGKPPLELD